MDDKEKAEVRNKQAQTDQIYSDLGVLSPEVIAKARFGGDRYSLETNIDEDAWKAVAAAKPDPAKEQA